MKVNISRNSCEMCDRVTLNVSGAWALALASRQGGASKASKGGAGRPALIINPPRPARV